MLSEFWSVYVFLLMEMLKNVSIIDKLNYQNVDQSYVDKLNINNIYQLGIRNNNVNICFEFL
jgi:hypothetical protein